MDYEVNSDVNWRKVGGSVRNMARAGLVTATEKVTPFSQNYAFEMTVFPVKRTSRNPGDAGICLVSPDKQLIWRVLLVDNGKKRYADLRVESRNEQINRKSCDVKCVSGSGFRWQYGKPYRLYIECRNRVITSKVSLDGKTLVSHTAKAPADVPYICGFHSGAMLAQYSEPAARWGEAAKVVRKPLKLNKPVYVPSRNISGKFRAEPTGFFYTKQDDKGYWWLIDPAGNAMFACGADGINWQGRSCEALGYSEYNRSVRARFDNEKEWMFHTKKRLEDWGFNFAGTCSNVFRTHIPFANNLMIGSTFASLGDEYDVCPYKGHVGTALPNPFHPRFGEYAKKRYLRNVGAEVENPYFLGYYCDNELRWGGMAHGGASDGSGLFDTVMAKHPSHTAKTALVKQLKENYKDDVKAFNKDWNTSLSSIDELLNMKQLPHTTAKQLELKLDFLRLTSETYFKSIHDNIKEIDPNHLFLGCRYAGVQTHEIIWKANAKYSDIISFNIYPNWDRNRNELYGPASKTMNQIFDRIYRMCNRPIMVTEWAFLGLDVGLPCTIGAGQRFLTQKERAQAAGFFYKTMLGHKALVGCSWYEFSDDPALGVRTRHPENCNYGLVNKFDEPYEALVNTFAEINKDIDKSRTFVNTPLPDGKTGNLYAEFNKRTPAEKQVKVKLTNSGFDVSNGQLRLVTEKNGRTTVYFRNKKMGYVNYTLNTQNKVRTWSASENCRDIKVTHLQNGVEIQFTGDSKSVNGSQAVTMRLFVPAKGQHFIADLVSVKNTGSSDLFVRGIYFVIKSALDNLPPDPQLGRSKQSSWDIGAWVTKDADFLAAANSLGKFNVLFFRHPKEGDKADCVREFEYTVKPQESVTPETPAYLIIYAGNGAHESRGRKLIDADIK